MLQRVPDNSLILKGQGEKGEHIEAFHAADKSYAMIYLPVGKTITVNTTSMPDKIIAWWFNPKNAEAQQINFTEKTGSMQFTSPTTGTGNDWVLVIDDAAKGYKTPGK